MRLIGHLTTEPGARSFGDFLLVNGIENTVEEDAPGHWNIWVSDEDKLDVAKGFLDQFRANPQDARFTDKQHEAAEVRARKDKDQADWEKRVKDRKTLFRQTVMSGIQPLTLVLMVISVIVYVLGITGAGARFEGFLLISQFTDPSLVEVRHGQVWRLVTPIFLHSTSTIIHILFNMLWLKDLGSVIEARLGTAYLGFMVLALAVGSNLAQFYISGSPGFGGMSGVVYGLFGYIWIRGKLDPFSGFFIHPTVFIIMMLWFGLAFMNVFTNIANWAHAGGLVIGLAIGYLDTVRSTGR